MKITKRYRLQILGVLCVACYILVTDVASRMADLIDRYGELKKKEKMILSPEEFSQRKHALERQKRELARLAQSVVASASGDARESSIGVFDYVSKQSRSSGIRLESLTPKEEHPSGSGVDASFSLSYSAHYHDAARFVNLIETGEVPVVITQLSMQSGQTGNTQTLNIALEGRAHLSKHVQ